MVHDAIKIRRRLVAVVALGAIMVAVLFGWHAYTRPPMPSYQGDGVFQDLRSRGLGPAYSVAMPEFDLGQPYYSEYRVAGLTKVGYDCGLYFAMRATRQWSDFPDFSRLDDTVTLEITDQQGREHVKFMGRSRPSAGRQMMKSSNCSKRQRLWSPWATMLGHRLQTERPCLPGPGVRPVEAWA
jgi:hypothetical protein